MVLMDDMIDIIVQLQALNAHAPLFQEVLNSGRLRGHFEENPRDMAALRHDKALHTVKQQTHLKNVPEYIIPKTLKRMAAPGGGGGEGGGKKKRFRGAHSSQAKRKFERNKADPLKSLGKKK